tara:strand:- start:146 stop:424 length:279 start_codon:yes stop_codon:yes gene_type:complete
MMSYNLSEVIKDLSLCRNERKMIDPGGVERSLCVLKEKDKDNDAYVVATLNEILDKINDITFLNLAQEQKLHDLATRVQVLRDEVLKIYKNR